MWYYGGVLTTALLETELGIVLDVCLWLCAHYLPIYYTCLFILFSSSFYIFLHLKIGPFSTRIIGQGGKEVLLIECTEKRVFSGNSNQANAMLF